MPIELAGLEGTNIPASGEVLNGPTVSDEVVRLPRDSHEVPKVRYLPLP